MDSVVVVLHISQHPTFDSIEQIQQTLNTKNPHTFKSIFNMGSLWKNRCIILLEKLHCSLLVASFISMEKRESRKPLTFLNTLI
jgi:hypothetical protein